LVPSNLEGPSLASLAVVATVEFPAYPHEVPMKMGVSVVARTSTTAEGTSQEPSAPLGRTMAEGGPGIATGGGIVL
jgi:hypothetical protein